MLSLLLAIACSTEPALLPADAHDPGPQPVCEWSAAPLGMDEDPGVGFTAAQVLAATTGPRAAALQWDWTGETTTLHSELAGDGDPSWMTAEVVNSETGEPWVPEEGDTGGTEDLCPAYMAIPVTWAASTEDGRLEVAVSGRVAVSVPTVASLVVEVPLEDLGGSGIPMEIDPAEWDAVRYELTVSASETVKGEGGSLGEIAVYADRTYETEDAAHDEGYVNDVARWPVEG